MEDEIGDREWRLHEALKAKPKKAINPDD